MLAFENTNDTFELFNVIFFKSLQVIIKYNPTCNTRDYILELLKFVLNKIRRVKRVR